MGNTAESILSELACFVLTVKPPGFVSPVTLEAWWLVRMVLRRPHGLGIKRLAQRTIDGGIY